MSRKSTVHLAKKAGGSLQKAGARGCVGGGFYSASMLAVASSRMLTGASFRMDAAAFHVPEAGDEVAEGGLAGAGGADDVGHGLIRERHADVAENRLFLIGEADVVKDDGVARRGDGFANENQLRSKTFLISWPNYNKNKRSGQCDS